MKYYTYRFSERHGEFQHYHYMLVRCETIAEAQSRARNVCKNFYGDSKWNEDFKWWEFEDGHVCISEPTTIEEVTLEEWFMRQYKRMLWDSEEEDFQIKITNQS